MVRKSGNLDGTGERRESDKKVETKRKVEDDVDALFRLPLAEFTGTRPAHSRKGVQRARVIVRAGR